MQKSLPLIHTRRTATGTRERILDVSARIFRTRGYAETTMNDIAEATGIKAASIYYYFRSKDEIVEEVLNLGTLRAFEAVRHKIGRAHVCTPVTNAHVVRRLLLERKNGRQQ